MKRLTREQREKAMSVSPKEYPQEMPCLICGYRWMQHRGMLCPIRPGSMVPVDARVLGACERTGIRCRWSCARAPLPARCTVTRPPVAQPGRSYEAGTGVGRGMAHGRASGAYSIVQDYGPSGDYKRNSIAQPSPTTRSPSRAERCSGRAPRARR